jgi:hypothetical protein
VFHVPSSMSSVECVVICKLLSVKVLVTVGMCNFIEILFLLLSMCSVFEKEKEFESVIGLTCASVQ